MTIEQLERGQKLLKDIMEYEKRLAYVKQGDIIIKCGNSSVMLTEDIFQELIKAQLEKDLNFLKERFDKL